MRSPKPFFDFTASKSRVCSKEAGIRTLDYRYAALDMVMGSLIANNNSLTKWVGADRISVLLIIIRRMNMALVSVVSATGRQGLA
jgi:hypothetical protein